MAVRLSHRTEPDAKSTGCAPGPNQPRLVSLWANDVGKTKDAVSRFRELSASQIADHLHQIPDLTLRRRFAAFEVLRYAETVKERQHNIGDHTRVQSRLFRLDVFYQQSREFSGCRSACPPIPRMCRRSVRRRPRAP